MVQTNVNFCIAEEVNLDLWNLNLRSSLLVRLPAEIDGQNS
jgi:hypothetical protein